MTRLQEKYKKKVVPAMKEKFGYKNNLAVPRLSKVVLNVGLGSGLKDSKFEGTVEDTLIRITGLKPIKTRARKSIAGFKIRKGMIVGMTVTLRRQKMYDFVDKLINITLPRVRDFKGLSPKFVDERGNLSIGFRENVCFPEIRPDEVERLHGLEATIVTTAKNKEQGIELLKLLGLPFREN